MFERNKIIKELSIDPSKLFVVMDDKSGSNFELYDILKLKLDDNSRSPNFIRLSDNNDSCVYLYRLTYLSSVYWHAPTKEAWVALITKFQAMGFGWMSGDKRILEECWETYKEKTAIFLEDDKRIEFGDTKYAKEFICEIIPYKDCPVEIKETTYSAPHKGIIKKLMCEPIAKIVSAVRNSLLSADDKLLRKHGLQDEHGQPTEAYDALMMDILRDEKKAEIIEQVKKIDAEEKK